jgi:hypothetical protein
MEGSVNIKAHGRKKTIGFRRFRDIRAAGAEGGGRLTETPG